MAIVGLRITVETDAMTDALADFEAVQRALIKCHGSDFRRLERRVEAFMENPSDGVEIHWVGGALLAAPKGEFTEILRDARRLGVIA